MLAGILIALPAARADTDVVTLVKRLIRKGQKAQPHEICVIWEDMKSRKFLHDVSRIDNQHYFVDRALKERAKLTCKISRTEARTQNELAAGPPASFLRKTGRRWRRRSPNSRPATRSASSRPSRAVSG